MESLKKNSDFKQVYDHKKSMANRLLVMYKRPNGLHFNRLGISISRKVGKAVVRNRIRRLVKEHYRAYEKVKEVDKVSRVGIKQGFDLVVVVRVPSGNLPPKADFSEIGHALKHLLGKHGLRTGL